MTPCPRPDCPRRKRNKPAKRKHLRNIQLVGNSIRNRRKQLGMSQYDLSIALCAQTAGSHKHLEPPRISEIERGVRRVDYPLLESIATVLECSVGYLVDTQPKPFTIKATRTPRVKTEPTYKSEFHRILSNIQKFQQRRAANDHLIFTA